MSSCCDQAGTPLKTLADVIHPFPAFNRVLGASLDELAAKVERNHGGHNERHRDVSRHHSDAWKTCGTRPSRLGGSSLHSRDAAGVAACEIARTLGWIVFSFARVSAAAGMQLGDCSQAGAVHFKRGLPRNRICFCGGSTDWRERIGYCSHSFLLPRVALSHG